MTLSDNVIIGYNWRVHPPPVAGIDKRTEGFMMNPMMSPNLKNMMVTPTRIFKRLGGEILGINLPLAGTGQELLQFIDGIGDKHLMALTDTYAFVYEADALNWINLNPVVAVIEDCEDNWNASTAVSTPSPKKGTYCININIDSDVAVDDLLDFENITQDCSTGKALTFWLRCDKALSAGSIKVVLCDNASGVKGTNGVEFSTPIAMIADTWYEFTIPADISALDSCASVAVWAGHATELDGNVTVTNIYIDDIRLVNAFTAGSRWSHEIIYDSSEAWSSATALLISNGAAFPHWWDGSAGTVFAVDDHLEDGNSDGITDFANCNELGFHGYHLFFYNFNDSVQRTKNGRWANIDDHDDWVNGTTGEKIFVDARGVISRAVQFKKFIFVYTENSITTQMYIGGAQIFTFDTLVPDIGLYAPRAIWSTPLAHYFFGSDQRLYAYAGGDNLLPIGLSIEEDLFQRLSIGNKDNIVFGLDSSRQRLYMCYPERGSYDDTYAQSYVALNLREQTPLFEEGRFGFDIRGFSVFSNQVLYTANGPFFAGRTCDEEPYASMRCDNAYLQDAYPMATVLDSDGYVYTLSQTTGQDNAVDIPCRLETPDFTIRLGTMEYSGRWTGFAFNACCCDSLSDDDSTVIVEYSIDFGVTWVALPDSPVTLNTAWTEHVLELDVKARNIRFRFDQDSDGDFQLRALATKVREDTARE